MDTLGLLRVVVVTAASVQDRDGARLLLGRLPGGCKKRRKIWVDGGYSGRLVDWSRTEFGAAWRWCGAPRRPDSLCGCLAAG